LMPVPSKISSLKLSSLYKTQKYAIGHIFFLCTDFSWINQAGNTTHTVHPYWKTYAVGSPYYALWKTLLGLSPCYHAFTNLIDKFSQKMMDTMMMPGCQAITSPHKLNAQDVVSMLSSGKPNLMFTSHQIWNPSRRNFKITHKPLLRRALRAGPPDPPFKGLC
jgi:hypothetical protein